MHRGKRDLSQKFSNVGTFPPMKHESRSAGIFSCHSLLEGWRVGCGDHYYWPLEDSTQGCCQHVTMHRTDPHNKEVSNSQCQHGQDREKLSYKDLGWEPNL